MALVNISQYWERPTSITFPKVWKNFEYLISGKVQKFCIKDITEDMFDTVIELCSVDVYAAEPLRICTEILTDRISVEEEQALWRHTLKQRLSLICLVENEDGFSEIASILISSRCAQNDPEYAFRGNITRKIALLTNYVMRQSDLYNQFNIKEMIIDIGDFIPLRYALPPIINNLLECRAHITALSGIRRTFGFATSEEIRDTYITFGFNVITVRSYKELANIDARLHIPGIQRHAQCVYLMYYILAT